ncbi:type I-E CRISPR-associated protein Cse1/CasA [Leptospira santarosai]|uniref:CRISPR-associated protein CasA/Cse1, type TIGR02547 n=2 Tax=Leptospira santarosai TaxID=28183 RepID=A0A0E2BAZ5_9LEPT|nr:type I-E CRISPR-associated protein Cse1/CasA [Leptospira santarosai]EKO32513.1 CRISPR-associated protein CasA/Cse1, type TIGR02547 [Leptospira santarosai str. MOR084]EKR90048.1 CRISPR-associated protein CasA/Cse1, type TIGR02547 [Leptospira santarosai str. CBC379]EMN23237.1 CRISPR-associated protein CasA/Cse1, type TIGR02547 [Leptospira santarosai serovar Arenal str. MAVJ 401]EMO14863.1 CRISPR-associated protein CasA/Cse1, type I-E [Leptospira santarosai str. CBC523]EMO23363.1 CRISPR-associ
MNLIKDVWIPTLRFSGKSAEISPFEITSQIENDSDPIVSLNSPRPDFNGALLQFLTGLLQVVFPPENEIEWEDLFVNPPSPEILKEAMTKAESAFELFGDGSRFMQDTNLNEEDTIFDISALFIESPGENTIKLKKDFFIKRNSISQICEKCAGIGLFSFQTNSPSGGQGHLTSIRGGGPLTTFVTSKLKNPKKNSLWSILWLNVLPKSYFQVNGHKKIPFQSVFPWTNPKIEDLQSKGKTTTPQDLHPLSVYWSYPRRILLRKETENGVCDVCNRSSSVLVRSYHTRTYGLSYSEGGWIHPFSPYYKSKESWLPYHPQPGGILYHYWQTITLGKDQENQAALVIRRFLNRKIPGEQTSILTFGYDMDNMKARCWYESEIPFFNVPPDTIEKFEEQISQILNASAEVKKNLRQAVRNAWLDKKNDSKGDLTFLDVSFLKVTESPFYDLIRIVKETLISGITDLSTLKETWLNLLNESALKLFDQYADSGNFEFENIERIVNARKDLRTKDLGSKTRTTLGLIIPEKKSKRSKK